MSDLIWLRIDFLIIFGAVVGTLSVCLDLYF